MILAVERLKCHRQRREMWFFFALISILRWNLAWEYSMHAGQPWTKDNIFAMKQEMNDYYVFLRFWFYHRLCLELSIKSGITSSLMIFLIKYIKSICKVLFAGLEIFKSLYWDPSSNDGICLDCLFPAYPQVWFQSQISRYCLWCAQDLWILGLLLQYKRHFSAICMILIHKQWRSNVRENQRDV